MPDTDLNKDILIGTNFTENPNIFNYRVDNKLTFKNLNEIPWALDNLQCGDLSETETTAIAI
jgi:hypothetical protein